MKLFVTIYNDARLLEHFLRHYASAGVTRFFIAAAPEFTNLVKGFSDTYPITLFDLAGYESLVGGSATITEMRRLHQFEGEWIIIVDLDEFVEFPDGLQAVVSSADKARVTVVRGVMLDRFSADGRLPDVGPDSDLPTLFPIKSHFIKKVMRSIDYKGVLVKGLLRPRVGTGHHRFEDERLFPQVLEISHYKWIAGAVERLRASHQVVLNSGANWGVEYERILNHYDTHGRFEWEEFGGKPAHEFEPDLWLRCVDCGAPILEVEREYSVTHFGKPLCRFDQKLYASRLS